LPNRRQSNASPAHPTPAQVDANVAGLLGAAEVSGVGIAIIDNGQIGFSKHGTSTFTNTTCSVTAGA
jgi:hypothetical protein